MNGELLKTSTECTSVLALGTSMIGISSVLEKISGVLDKGAKAGEGVTKTMKATYPSHPGPGNLNVADTTRSTDDMRNEANGFAANLGQQLSNLGDFSCHYSINCLFKTIIRNKFFRFFKKIIII